eukprot:TRINITY_DN2415_c0_g1_i1.p1 TRINITY_DN2415_c0_g1~~TRINITY_DN2415_c0_g1_i1.p1  ORF type:complete len:1836 (+),score=432.42 TRINITY_DN2415_c0_g1_i1:272-5779(+)
MIFPGDPADSLQLTGRFAYVICKVSAPQRGEKPQKHFVFHIEVATGQGPIVRISVSNLFREERATATQLQLPFTGSPRWTVVAIDLPAVLAKHFPTRPYRHVRGAQFCSHMAVRALLTSDLLYTPATLPVECALPQPEGGRDWADNYDWVWVEQPAPDDPVAVAPPPSHARKPADLFGASTVTASAAHRDGAQRESEHGAHARLIAQRRGGAARRNRSPGEPSRGAGLELRALLHITDPKQVIVGRQRRVLWAAGKTLVECDAENGGRQAHIMGHSAPAELLFTDAGRRWICSVQASPPLLRVWDHAGGNNAALAAVPLGQHMGGVACAALADDLSSVLLVGRGGGKRKTQLALLDVARLPHAGGTLRHSTDAGATVCAFVTGEAARFATLDGGPTMRCWRVRDGQMRSLCISARQGHRFLCLAFVPPPRPQTPTARAVVGTKEGYVYVVNTDSHTVEAVHRTHSGAVTGIAASVGMCITGGADGLVRLWPLDFGDFLLEAKHESPVAAVSVSRDGLAVAAATASRSVGVLDYPSHEYLTLLRGHGAGLTAAAAHPSRPLCATACEDITVRVWDTATLDCVARYNCRELGPPPSGDKPIAPLPAGQHAETPLMLMGPADLDSGEPLAPTALVWHDAAEPAVIAVGFHGGAVGIFDADHACLLHRHHSHTAPVHALLYTRNGRWLASLGRDALCFAEVRQSYHVARAVHFTHPCPSPRALAESPDGRLLALVGATGATVHLYDAAAAVELATVRESECDASPAAGISQLEFTGPDTLALATGDGRVVVLEFLKAPPSAADTDSGLPPPELPVRRLARCGGGRCGGLLQVEPAAGRVAACRGGGPSAETLALCRLPPGAPAVLGRYQGAAGPLTALAWCPSQSGMLLSCDAAGCLGVWQLTEPPGGGGSASPSPRRGEQQRLLQPQPSPQPASQGPSEAGEETEGERTPPRQPAPERGPGPQLPGAESGHPPVPPTTPPEPSSYGVLPNTTRSTLPAVAGAALTGRPHRPGFSVELRCPPLSLAQLGVDAGCAGVASPTSAQEAAATLASCLPAAGGGLGTDSALWLPCGAVVSAHHAALCADVREAQPDRSALRAAWRAAQQGAPSEDGESGERDPDAAELATALRAAAAADGAAGAELALLADRLDGLYAPRGPVGWGELEVAAAALALPPLRSQRAVACPGVVTTLAAHPEGRTVVAAAAARGCSGVCLWDPLREEEPRLDRGALPWSWYLGDSCGVIRSMAWGPHGRLLAAAERGLVLLSDGGTRSQPPTPFSALQVAPLASGGWCAVGAAGVASVWADLTQSSPRAVAQCAPRAAVTAAPGGAAALCCAEDPAAEGTVWVGADDGWLTAWRVQPPAPPCALHRVLVNDACTPLTGIGFSLGGEHCIVLGGLGELQPAVSCFQLARGADGTRSELRGVARHDLSGEGAPRCRPTPGADGRSLVAAASGALWAVGSAPAGAEGGGRQLLRGACIWRGGAPCVAAAHSAGPSGAARGGEAVLAAIGPLPQRPGAPQTLGVWHLAARGGGAHAPALVACCELPRPAAALLTDPSGVYCAEGGDIAHYEASVAGLPGAEPAEGATEGVLRERRRWRLSTLPITSAVWAAGGLAAATRGGGLFLLSTDGDGTAEALAEPDPAAVTEGTVCSVARPTEAERPPLLMHWTEDGVVCIYEGSAGPSGICYDPVSRFSTPSPPCDCQLSPCGGLAVYLQHSDGGAALVAYDFREQRVERVVTLHCRFRRFALSPDRVFAVLWNPVGPEGEQRAHLLCVYDFDYSTYQEISAHLLPITWVGFVLGGEGLVTIAASESSLQGPSGFPAEHCDFEAYSWHVKKLT